MSNRNQVARKRYYPGFRQTKGQGFTITENPNERRIIITFDGRLDYNASELLHAMGFKWNRSRLGWTRYLNDDGRRAAEFVAGRLNQAASTPSQNLAS